MSKSPTLFSSDDEDEGSHQEITVLRKFQAMLQGVPPPSSVTMSKLSVSDMLTKYNENKPTFGVQSELCCTTQKYIQKNNTTPLVYYLNSSQTSEEIANLSQKVQSRYVYSETLSSCNIWFDSAIRTNSVKKRSGRRNGFGLSPGSRLSHLARRRQIFSCENLQQLANSDKRHHIEIRKNDAFKNKNLVQNETVEFKKLNLSKRALFQSPDDEEKKESNPVSCNSVKRNLFAISDQEKASNSKIVGLQNSMGGYPKKRKRRESREKVWPKRALSFAEEEEEVLKKSQEMKNSKVMSELQLSLHHKSKLLWAVSVTLKERNMCSKDPQFKTCASALFMICRENLGKILSSKVEGGTSEKMLHFAKEQINGIFKKLGISREDNLKDRNLECLVGKSNESSSDIFDQTKGN